SNVESIGSRTFYGMTNLNTLVIEEGSKLQTIGASAFQNTTRLLSVNLPEGLTTIGANAFNNSGITSVIIPSTVTSIGNAAFIKTKNLRSAKFAEGTKITTIPAEM